MKTEKQIEAGNMHRGIEMGRDCLPTRNHRDAFHHFTFQQMFPRNYASHLILLFCFHETRLYHNSKLLQFSESLCNDKNFFNNNSQNNIDSECSGQCVCCADNKWERTRQQHSSSSRSKKTPKLKELNLARLQERIK